MNASSPLTASPEEAGAFAASRRLLIVRLGAMGDVIHSLPAATALRGAFPKSTLGWLIEERWAELLCTLPTPRSGPRSPQRPLADRIHAIDTRRWRAAPFSAQTWESMAAGLSDLRAGHYEVAVDLQGAVRSALLARWSGAPLVYGAAQPRENVASMFYSRQVLLRGTHVVEQNLGIAEAVTGCRLRIPRIELPLDPAAERECNNWLKGRGIESFALVTPGAGWGAKKWPAGQYGDVARQLGSDGLRSVVNLGPGEDELARAMVASSGGAAEVFSGSLTQLIALTRRAALFIGGDTGPMHLAAAMRVPVVAIFGPTDPARNGPFGTRSIVLRSVASPTSYSHVDRADGGLLQISAAEVLAAARRLLQVNHV